MLGMSQAKKNGVSRKGWVTAWMVEGLLDANLIYEKNTLGGYQMSY